MYYRISNRPSTGTSRFHFLNLLSFSHILGFSLAQSAKQSQNPSQSLCIAQTLVQTAAATDGIIDPANPDHFAKSLISQNNFIQFCAGHQLTNGQQVSQGSCNPTPMGLIPSSKNMPSVRILSPSPTKKIAAHQSFDVTIAVRNIEMGFFTSPKNTYYLAPQQLNQNGLIQGHLHVVIQLLHGTKPLDPLEFVFFKGIADKAVNGKLNTTITGGLSDGIYRISTLTSAMNHQPVVLPIAKRGAVEDTIYITVGTGISSPEKAGGEITTAAKPNGGSQLLSIDKNQPGESNHIAGETNRNGSNTEPSPNTKTKPKKHDKGSKKRGEKEKAQHNSHTLK